MCAIPRACAAVLAVERFSFMSTLVHPNRASKDRSCGVFRAGFEGQVSVVELLRVGRRYAIISANNDNATLTTKGIHTDIMPSIG